MHLCIPKPEDFRAAAMIQRQSKSGRLPGTDKTLPNILNLQGQTPITRPRILSNTMAAPTFSNRKPRPKYYVGAAIGRPLGFCRCRNKTKNWAFSLPPPFGHLPHQREASCSPPHPNAFPSVEGGTAQAVTEEVPSPLGCCRAQPGFKSTKAPQLSTFNCQLSQFLPRFILNSL